VIITLIPEGANPTISVVKIYNATSSRVHFGNKNIFFCFGNRSILCTTVVVDVNSAVVGSAPMLMVVVFQDPRRLGAEEGGAAEESSRANRFAHFEAERGNPGRR
jgi:hypothetical protein